MIGDQMWLRLTTATLVLGTLICSCGKGQDGIYTNYGASNLGASYNSNIRLDKPAQSPHFVAGGGDGAENGNGTNVTLPKAEDCPGYFVASVVSDPNEWKPTSERSLERGAQTLSEKELIYFFADKAITDEQIKLLRTIDRLAAVSLSFCTITDAAMDSLASTAEVRYLNLSFCDNITNEGLELLASMKKLRKLNLCGCKQLSDLGVILQAKSNLVSIDLSFTKATELSVGAFTKSRLLEEIAIGGCPDMSRAVVDEILKLDKLQVIALDHSPWLNDQSLLRLKALAALKSLRVDGCEKLTESALTGLGQFEKLEELSLEDCKQFSGAEIRGLLKVSTTIRRLNIKGCEKVSGEDLAGLKTDFPKVSIVN